MRRFASVLVCLAAATTASFTGAQDNFQRAKLRYDECLKRLPFLMHDRGRIALARSHEPRALEVLVRSYRRPKAPAEPARFRIASLIAKHFRAPEHLEQLEQWRKSNRKPRDAWLWKRELEILFRHKGPEEIAEIARGSGPALFRAAALEALAEVRSRTLYELLPEILADLPRKPFDRALLVESCARGAWRVGGLPNKEPLRGVLERLIAQLEEKRTPERSKLVIVRHLGEIFNSESRSLEPRVWRRYLIAGRNKEVDASREGYAATFIGIPTAGRRIVYVIDMSDSMLTPLPEHLRNRGATTGVTRKRKRDRVFGDDYQIAWHKVTNRFDLAREQLKVSIANLGEDREFAVVWFGTEAGLLKGCTGMMKASRRNKARIARALDAISPGPTEMHRPHGTLRGYTNLHGGIRRAFAVTGRGLAKGDPYVDPRPYFEGAETLFILSDGDPTYADWVETDQNYHEDQLGDPETRSNDGAGEMVVYPGPHRDWPVLVDDVERLNTFRKCEIHCLAIGEVTVSQLEKLAKMGLGRTKRFGK